MLRTGPGSEGAPVSIISLHEGLKLWKATYQTGHLEPGQDRPAAGAVRNGEFNLMYKVFSFLQRAFSHVLLLWCKMNAFFLSERRQINDQKAGPSEVQKRDFASGVDHLNHSSPAS